MIIDNQTNTEIYPHDNEVLAERDWHIIKLEMALARTPVILAGKKDELLGWLDYVKRGLESCGT